MEKCLLDNMRLRKYRKDPVYQTIIIDLGMSGAIDLSLAQKILGYTIPKYIKPVVEKEVYDADKTADE